MLLVLFGMSEACSSTHGSSAFSQFGAEGGGGTGGTPAIGAGSMPYSTVTSGGTNGSNAGAASTYGASGSSAGAASTYGTSANSNAIAVSGGASNAGASATSGGSAVAGANGNPLLDGCASTTLAATLLPPNILFLIDRSGSMNCNLPSVTPSQDCERMATRQDPTKPSKWDIVKGALEAAVRQLPATASVGITYFSNDDMCGVQSKPNVELALLDPPQVDSLVASLDAVQPSGGTPIVGAMILGYKRFNPDQTPNQPFGKKIVVLLTDGQEGCATDSIDRLIRTEMPNAIKARITTFVIGVPGSEVDRSFLSQMAFAGGAPSRTDCNHTSTDPTVGDCHFDMTMQPDLAQALNTALATISGHALQCEFDIPQPPAGQTLDYGAVNIAYQMAAGGAEQLIAQDNAGACDSGANGWQYNTDYSKIVLCGAACDTVRQAAAIRIVLGCKSWVVR
jgi:hypothetical protein